MPQVCLLFGPSAAGGAYIPAFCDVVIMREGNASMYLGSPRMAEMVIGEKVTLEEMGGAKMHTSVSGCGHFLARSDADAIDLAKRYLSYMPKSWREAPPSAPPAEPAAGTAVSEIVPADENAAFDVADLIDALVDADSFLEVHDRWAKEVVVGFARLDGRAIGIVANQPKVKGGVLFVDSADKAARFIWTCNAFNVPLLFLADVPGFMIGTQVERQGIIRHGAKMISAVSEATVPKLSVIVRKAYGAGLYAMAGPAFEPDCCIALPTASIAVMGPQAAINAVFYNQIQEIEDPARARGVRAAKARRVRRRHRHPPPRLGAGGRCRDRARRAARRADPALRAGGGQGPPLLASGTIRSRPLERRVAVTALKLRYRFGMRPSARSPLLAAAACFLAFAVVLACAYAIAPIERLDAIALHGLRALDGGPAGLANVARSHSADPLPLLVVLAVLFAWGWALGRRREAIAAVALVAGANLIALILKVALAHPRYHPFSERTRWAPRPSRAATRRARCRSRSPPCWWLRRGCGLPSPSVAAAYVIAVVDLAAGARLALPQRRAWGAAGLLRLLLPGCRRRPRGHRCAARASRLNRAGLALSPGLGGAAVAVLAGAGLIACLAPTSCSHSRACTRWPPRPRSPSWRSRPRLVASATLICRTLTARPWPGLRSAAGAPSGASTFSLPEAVYLQRHGADRYVLPHRIDHVANMRSLAEAGCDRVLALGSVGGLQPELGPGTFVCPDDFIALGAGPAAFDDERAHSVPRFDPGWRRRRRGRLAGPGRLADSWTAASTGRPAARGWRRPRRSA